MLWCVCMFALSLVQELALNTTLSQQSSGFTFTNRLFRLFLFDIHSSHRNSDLWNYAINQTRRRSRRPELIFIEGGREYEVPLNRPSVLDSFHAVLRESLTAWTTRVFHYSCASLASPSLSLPREVDDVKHFKTKVMRDLSSNNFTIIMRKKLKIATECDFPLAITFCHVCYRSASREGEQTNRGTQWSLMNWKFHGTA